MPEVPNYPTTDVSTVEFHYWLGRNDTHTMDAFVQNKCEHEILASIKVLAAALDLVITVETEPLGNGSLKRIWKIISTQEEKKALVTTAVITAFLTTLFTAPMTKLSEKAIEKLFEDTEVKQLDKDRLRLEVNKLRREASETPPNAEKQILLKKRASNFYEQLEKEKNVEGVTIFSSDSTGAKILFKRRVPRSAFSQFILADDTLPSLFIEHAVIEIVAPVLKKGKYKWLGIYGDATIHFSMKSSEFKELVQGGQVEFKNGSSIDCVLEVKRKIGSDGEEKIAGYEVLVVNRYFDNDVPIETIEGRKRRTQTMVEQGNLFEEED